MKKKSLSDILLENGSLSEERLKEALALEKGNGERLDKTLLRLGYVQEEELLRALGLQLGLPYLEKIKEGEGDFSLASRLPLSFLRKYYIFPLKRENNLLTAVTSDPLDPHPADEIGALLGCPVQLVISRKEEILKAIDRYCHSESETPQEMIEGLNEGEIRVVVSGRGEEPEDLLDLANKAPIIKLVNLILFQALKERASDIHIQPYEKELKVRYRVDGILHDALTPPKHYQEAVISRIKVMSNLNIAEHRLPQDGRATIKVGDRQIDIRVSVIPTAFGERVVMRLLDKETLFFGLEELGISPEKLPEINSLIHFSHGIILVTGPTGSGKTTTLYAALDKINFPDKNIITVEDPIEYQLEGISQIQVKPQIGLTFANGLRSIVRQDPDIIMIGEIRDLETAEIAIHASLTGHLVFSTLHTNDAPGAVTRMLDMGIEPYLVSSSVIAIIAQRLVRLICLRCKESYQPEEESLREIGLGSHRLTEGTLYRGKGCSHCLNTGYWGRTGIYELLTMSEEIRELVLSRTEANTIKKRATEKGMFTLRQDGAHKVLQGLTTIEEVLRVTQEDIS
jgi:general secretion pathway protein E